MEDIRFYSFSFSLLAIQNDAAAVDWSIKYNGIGTFEAHFPKESPVTALTLTHPYLVAVQGEKQAVVTGVQAGRETVVYGRTLNWLLSKRTVAAFRSENLGTEGVRTLSGLISHVVNEAFLENAYYPVTNMTLSCPLERTVGDFWRNTRNPSHKVIRDLCVRGNHAGHRMVFDRSKREWRLEIYAGRELSLLISEGSRNGYDTEINRDCLDYATDGWYERDMEDKGDWNAAENQPPISLTTAYPQQKYCYYRVSEGGKVGAVTFESGDYLLCGADGYYRRTTRLEPVWDHVSREGVTQTGMLRWEERLGGGSASEAADSLLTKERSDAITAQICNLTYGTDYALGDVVRVQYESGGKVFCYRRRIGEINISYEGGTERIQPVFTDDRAEEEEE